MVNLLREQWHSFEREKKSKFRTATLYRQQDVTEIIGSII